ncbi:hypothetical protein FB567DRAFT_538991 [Paraphoma chrysanthemicola]|uniref:gamma-glutamylcyclotransferase n=1 Tax=Paraphoma chrysanthemicola TaxID=798071 RepID=A0A8K0QTW0_9PLEO|nr:hypothetical protein FB567DRAFT_538991 [Paraphoma chrysanthemicola]
MLFLHYSALFISLSTSAILPLQSHFQLQQYPLPNQDQDQDNQHTMSTTSTKPTIYFGYGSNLWLHQMSIRCPEAKYLGIARLSNYTWIINDRGYANVVQLPSASSTPQSPSSKAEEEDYASKVYGLVYSLSPADESRLDKNEGVPIAYTKERLPCAFWSAGEPSDPVSPHSKIDVTGPADETLDMLVYIDRERVEPDEPRKEYVYRMNRGIEDAVSVGVPEGYVDAVMRKYIPGEREEERDGEMAEFARGQARQFKDESGVFR